MKEELKLAITKQIGSADAPRFIAYLEAMGIEDEARLYDRGVSIPLAFVENLENFQHALSALSRTGRAFTISAVGDRIQIDTLAMTSSPRLLGFPSTTMFAFKENIQHTNPLGILEEHVQLPEIQIGSKVLDIGAGTGLLAKRVKDSFSCEVYALEPSFERVSDFTSCVERLGEGHVKQLTLQEALKNHPEEYFQAFDVVCVFKYNVPYEQRENFIRTLSEVVKPDGKVYVTSVEPERFTVKRHYETVYLTDTFKKYFDNVSFVTRPSFYGADQLMTLTGPKLTLEDKVLPDVNPRF